MLLPPAVFAHRSGSPPTLSSVNYSQGDVRGGGESIIVTGTNLAAATALTIGGTTQTITATSATTVTATLAAKAASSGLDIVVTTPGGTATLSSAFEYWYPPTETSCTGFWDSGGYDETAGAGVWTKTTGQDMGVASGAPADTSGYPHFVKASGDYLRGLGTMGDYFDMSSGAAAKGSGLFVINMTGTPDAINGIETDGLVGDFGRGAFGVGISTSGFSLIASDGAYKLATAACTTSAWHTCSWRFASSDVLSVQVDGNKNDGTDGWQETSFGTHNHSALPLVQLGTNYDVQFSDVDMKAVAFFNVKVSDAVGVKMHKWGRQRYATPA